MKHRRGTSEATGHAGVDGRLVDVGHTHTDVTGGWLRPAVFGVMDGLVSNFALIAGMAGGVAGAGGDRGTVVLAGLAGLAAGAFPWRRVSTPRSPLRPSWRRPNWRSSGGNWPAAPKSRRRN